MMLSVSVIIATRNRPHLLVRAVESAWAAGTNVEVVVVDDASLEQTAHVCRALRNITYVRADHHQGLAGARNLGIIASSGDCISFLDDDDVRLPGSLDLQVQALESAPTAGLVYGQALIANQQGLPTGRFYPANCPQGDIFWKLLEWNFIPCPTTLFRKSCLYRVGLLNDTLTAAEDWDLWIRIAELYEILAVEQPVAMWREPTPTSNQYTSRCGEILQLCATLFEERWLRLPRARTAESSKLQNARRLFNDRITDQLIWQLLRELREGRMLYVAKTLSILARLGPLRTSTRMLRYSRLRLLAGTS